MTTPSKPVLENVQRWMQAVITHPHGVEAGLASEVARTYVDVPPGEVEQMIDRSLAQTSVERLGVYATAYYARLIECLEAEFPVFRQTVGEEAFADFAFAYLQQRPSSSYTLGDLGAGFSQFLDQTKPPSQNGEHAPDWPDLLVDLARLERTFSEVFDGQGVEGQRMLSADELLAIDAQHWPQARLSTVPCLRLLPLRFPLNDFYTAVKKGETPELPAAADSWLAVTRREYIVRRYELSRPQFVLLEALQRGQTVGEAISAAAEIYPGEIEGLAVELQQWFRVWSAAPLFLKVEKSKSPKV